MNAGEGAAPEGSAAGCGTVSGEAGAPPPGVAPERRAALHDGAPVGPDAIASRFEADGFCFPIRVIGETDAAINLHRVIRAEEAGEERSRLLRSKAHLAYRFIDRLARTPAILDCVERILGPDLLLWGSSCFVKAPGSPSYVSWHQDLNYWGLNSTDEVSAWLALSASTEANGCMRFVPGSHLRGKLAHRDSFEEDNLLSRGQELEVSVDEEEAVPVVLAPGEMSLHHGRVFHASGLNRSNDWRVGLALRYITPSMRQVVGIRDFAQLVRGEDRFGHFEEMPRPESDDDYAAMQRFEYVDGVTGSIFFATDPPYRPEDQDDLAGEVDPYGDEDWAEPDRPGRGA